MVIQPSDTLNFAIHYSEWLLVIVVSESELELTSKEINISI